MEIAAAAIGVADISARLSSKVWRLCENWHDAPKDIFHLRDELVSSNEFFGGVRRGLSSEREAADSKLGWPRETTQELEKLLLHGQFLVHKIQIIVDRVSSGATSPQIEPLSKRRKLEWLGKVNEINNLKKGLKETMWQTCAILMSLNLTVSSELRTSLRSSDARLAQQVATQASDTKDHINIALDASSSQVVYHIQDRISEASEDFNRTLEKTKNELIASLLDHFDKISERANSQLYRDITMMQSTIMEHVDRRLYDHQTRMIGIRGQQSLPDASEPGVIEAHLNRQEQKMAPMKRAIGSIGHSIARISGNRSRDTHLRSDLVNETAGSIQWSSFRCEIGCACQCHSQQRYGIRDFTPLQTILGSFSFSGRGFRLGGTSCTDSRCRGRDRSRWVRVDYNLPRWLLAATLSLRASNGMTGPEMLLRVVRRIPPDTISLSSSIFGFVHRGDIEGVKRLLRTGIASVHDVRADNGTPVLRQAIDCGNIEIAKLLLQAGADPLEPITARALIRYLVVEGTLLGAELGQVLPTATLLDDNDFSDLHKVVLGILPLNLETSLQSPHFASQLNQGSTEGFRPLHLAALRGDANAMRIMISAGANISEATAQGMSPLHYACLAGSLPAARFLLEAGATVNDSSQEGVTPLHCVANIETQDSSEVVAVLMHNGADPKLADSQGATAVVYAVHQGLNKVLDALIAHGADINTSDWEGDSPLFESLMNNAHHAAWLLLRSGARYDIVNNNGWGVLHHLASLADFEMLDIFTRASMRGLDRQLQDKAGRSPLQMLEGRPDASPEIRAKFSELLNSIKDVDILDEHPKHLAVGRDIECSDDEFFDAAERLISV